jgi:predicted transcriptional regulator of viral defense system
MTRATKPTSTPSRIERRIKRAGDDAVFSVSDFLDLDTRNAVDAALSWLTRKGTLRRLARGLYYRPRTNPYLGEIIPPKEAVVAALARRDHMRVRPIDASAANLLGLSEQVPAKVDYLTDGRTRTIKVGPHLITFRHVSPKTIAPESSTVGLVIAGLRNLGKNHVTPEHVRRLRASIPAEERRRLRQDLTLAPSWMHPHLNAIAGDEPA